MLASSVAICNVALSRIGHPAISSLSDSNEAARQCNIHYEPCRDTLLSSYPWSFAIKRTTLITEAEAAKTITGATSANPIVITAASHGYSDGDRVTIDDVGGMTEINGRDFVIDVLTSNTFSLLDENGTSYTTYTSGGTFIPQLTFSAAPGGTNQMGAGSYMIAEQVALSGFTAIGDWS